MSVTVVFESHSTTIDNENEVASGHFDAELSPRGIEQSKELGERYKNDHFDAVFCSDMQRAYKTAELAFGDRLPIIKDARLRECDYGSFTRKPSIEVAREKPNRITTPFPNGESYEQTNRRMGEFLKDLSRDYAGKKVMIIGHRATQNGLDTWINGLSIKEALTAPWKWQPGWTYKLNEVPL